MTTASGTSAFAHLVGHHGAAAVFVLMAIDALLPAGGELIMLLAGALAAGAIGDGTGGLGSGVTAYVALATAGTLGYLTGAIIGWAIARRGGRELVSRYGRLLHVGPERLSHAERWFADHGGAAVLLGRLTPVVRSFISVPAGVLGSPIGTYVALTLVGSAIWCFGFAGAGWALGDNWDAVHSAFRYINVVAVAGALGVAAWLMARRRSRAS